MGKSVTPGEEAEILLAAQEEAEAVLQGGQQKPEEVLLAARQKAERVLLAAQRRRRAGEWCMKVPAPSFRA